MDGDGGGDKGGGGDVGLCGVGGRNDSGSFVIYKYKIVVFNTLSHPSAHHTSDLFAP